MGGRRLEGLSRIYALALQDAGPERHLGTDFLANPRTPVVVGAISARSAVGGSRGQKREGRVGPDPQSQAVSPVEVARVRARDGRRELDMPILEIELVLGPHESVQPDLAARFARSAGEVFGGPAGRTWVRLTKLAAADYAEDGPHPEIFPVFVHVIQAARATGEDLRAEAHALAHAIAKDCGRSPEMVHVLYEEGAKGRLVFGGDVLVE